MSSSGDAYKRADPDMNDGVRGGCKGPDTNTSTGRVGCAPDYSKEKQKGLEGGIR